MLEAALERVVAEFDTGPADGVFTDGGCSGNPGPGGWGVVRVQGHRVIDRRRGEHPHTTNNRMELTALIAGYRMISPDEELTVWTDSELCVNTFNSWAAGWAKRGWRRKGGPIKNLELVQEAYALACAHPKVKLRWIKAHDGSRWNEYVDALATSPLKTR
jgi:ribonuclease HI